MGHPRDVALHAGLCLAVALSGIAAVYVLNEWVLPWWDARHPPRILPDSTDDKASPSIEPQQEEAPTMDASAVVPALTDPEYVCPNKDASSQTHSLPPPLPNGHAILSGSTIAINPDAMTSSASLHTLSSLDGIDEEDTLQSNTSDSDTEPFADVLSPSPAHVISRRRSVRNHDLFAASHISFSELGSLVAPQNEFQ